MTNKYSISMLLILLMIFSNSSYSALVNSDWKITGDDLITLDTDTGLGWLDLTETNGLSYNYVSSQLNMGGNFEGFRFASLLEFQDLFNKFGLPSEYTYYKANPIHPGIDTYRTFMGDIFYEVSPNTITGGFGIISEGSSLDNNYRLGAYYTYTGFTEITPTPINTIDSNSYQIETGSFLVRTSTVPIPSSVWLLVSGIAWLFGVTKFK